MLLLGAIGVASTRHGHDVASGEVTYCKTDGPLHAEFSTTEPLEDVVGDARGWKACERTYYGFPGDARSAKSEF